MSKVIEIDSDKLESLIRNVARKYTVYDWNIATEVSDSLTGEATDYKQEYEE